MSDAPKLPPAAVAGVSALLLVGLVLWIAREKPVYSPPADEISEDEGEAPASVGGAPPRPRRRTAPAASAPKMHRLTLSAEDREKGLGECAAPDPGDGFFLPKAVHPWGTLSVPRAGGHAGDFGFDVVVHFHGAEGARKALAPLRTGLVLVGIDRGEGSAAYEQAFPVPASFDALTKSLTSALVAVTRAPEAHIRRLALSSWSAGYGATVSLLRGGTDVDAVVFLDSLHGSYDPNAKGRGADAIHPLSLAPVLAFAARAKTGEKALYLTHSHIVPPGYPSTQEVATYLLRSLKIPRFAAPATDDPLGLITFADGGDFHVRNLGGTDPPAHCAHIGYLADAAESVLAPRWRTVPPPAP